MKFWPESHTWTLAEILKIDQFWSLSSFTVKLWKSVKMIKFDLKWLKAKVSSLICKKVSLRITECFKHISPRNLADLVNFGSPTKKNFYQHEKLKLNAVRICTISSEDIDIRHGVARKLWSWNSAYSITFCHCDQILLERMSIFILFWDMTS